MQRVITASLNGNAYQLEDDAHTALAAYLDAAARALAGNPDAAEILADLEQAIAEKCARFLSPHKSVLSRAEIETVVAEMGPVAGDAAQGPAAAPADGATATAAAAAPPAPRRFYRLRDGALAAGLCNGLAAYFALDVSIVRIVFVALVFLTGGAALLAYGLLWFIVPTASTSEEHAAAHGQPFNAQVLVDRVKAEFASNEWRRSRAQWKREWRRARAEWRLSWRQARHDWRAQFAGLHAGVVPPAPPSPHPGAPYVAHIVTGSLLAILGLVLGALTIAWIVALASLVMTGALLGFALPVGVPVWVAFVALVILFNLIVWPLKAARRAAYYPAVGYHAPWLAVWDSVIGLTLLALGAWYAVHHVPEIEAFFRQFAHAWRDSEMHQSI